MPQTLFIVQWSVNQLLSWSLPFPKLRHFSSCFNCEYFCNFCHISSAGVAYSIYCPHYTVVTECLSSSLCTQVYRSVYPIISHWWYIGFTPRAILAVFPVVNLLLKVETSAVRRLSGLLKYVIMLTLSVWPIMTVSNWIVQYDCFTYYNVKYNPYVFTCYR